MKNQNSVNVNRNNVVTDSEIRSGNSVFRLVRGEKGVSLQFRKNSLTIPNGAVGQAIIAELTAMVGGTAPATASAPASDKPKRVRRTKAQIEADNAAAAQAQSTPTPDASSTDA